MALDKKSVDTLSHELDQSSDEKINHGELQNNLAVLSLRLTKAMDYLKKLQGFSDLSQKIVMVEKATSSERTLLRTSLLYLFHSFDPKTFNWREEDYDGIDGVPAEREINQFTFDPDQLLISVPENQQNCCVIQ